MRTPRKTRLFFILLTMGLMGCGSTGAQDDATDVATDTVGPLKGLKVVFPSPATGAVCNGRTMDCMPRQGGGCEIFVDPVAEGWTEDVVVCHGVTDNPIHSPAVALLFKDSLPLWTPNLDSRGTVVADPRATAEVLAFLSPHLLTT